MTGIEKDLASEFGLPAEREAELKRLNDENEYLKAKCARLENHVLGVDRECEELRRELARAREQA